MHAIPRRSLALFLAISATVGGCSDAPPPRVGAPAEYLGAPFEQASPYARNVWDMQLFDGRIFLGHGDMIRNQGPVTLWSLAPATGRLTPGSRIAEEQVDVFRVLNGELYIPGQDPRGRPALGTFHRLEGGAWARHRTIPHALHTFDLAWHQGRLYAATGGRGRPGQASLLVSRDRGRTWLPVTGEVRRMFTLFEFRGQLYAAPGLRTDDHPASGTLLRLDGDRFVSTRLGGTTLLPGLADTAGRILRPVTFGDALVYVVVSGTIDWKPAALAFTRTLHDPRVIPLPHANDVPYDLLVRGRTLYVLAAAPSPPEGFTIHVYATNDLEHWRELFRFTAPTFARSFEESGGDFFFGLGSTFQSPSPATGAILRVRRTSYTRLQ